MERPGRRVGSAGSSETHLISGTENEMFRGLLTNCCIFYNRMRGCEELLRRGAWRPMPRSPFTRVLTLHKRVYIKIISASITGTMGLVCKVWHPKQPFLLLRLALSVRLLRTIIHPITWTFRTFIASFICCRVGLQCWFARDATFLTRRPIHTTGFLRSKNVTILVSH